MKRIQDICKIWMLAMLADILAISCERSNEIEALNNPLVTPFRSTSISTTTTIARVPSGRTAS